MTLGRHGRSGASDAARHDAAASSSARRVVVRLCVATRMTTQCNRVQVLRAAQQGAEEGMAGAIYSYVEGAGASSTINGAREEGGKLYARETDRCC